MKSPGLLLTALAALFLSHSFAAPAPKQTPKLKLPGPEVQNLMLGTWKIKTEYAPTKDLPKGGTGEGIETWRAGPGGYSVIEEFREKGAMGEISGLGTAWWDAAAQGQRFVWCDSTNSRGCELSKSVAKWEGNRMIYREDREEYGKKITHEEIFEDITPTTFLQTLSEGPAGGELKRTITIRATKIAGNPPESTPASAGRTGIRNDAKAQAMMPPTMMPPTPSAD